MSNTVFDSVFKTMMHKAPKLVIPLINEVFERSYGSDEPLVQFSNEHETPKGSRIDDTVFRLGEKIYHVECQSTTDANMVVRMIEYDFNIALERALSEGAPYRMELPASCVLFLRHNKNTPDMLSMEVMLPEGGSFTYAARVMKVQLVTEDEIFQKNLLLLLPYYLMRYENTLAQIAQDDAQTNKLLAECMDLRMRLAEATLEKGDDVLYQELTELIIRVSDHITRAHEALQKKVRAAMGGEVLELLGDRAERMEREAREEGLRLGREEGFAQGHEEGLELGREQGLEQGIEQGREQGIEQGREQGIEQGLEQGIEQGREQGIEQAISGLSKKLLELGVDEKLISEAVATVRYRQSTEETA